MEINKLKRNEKLNQLVKKLTDDLTSLSGTDFASSNFMLVEIQKQLLYDNCKAVIEHLDAEYCVECETSNT